MCQKCNNVLATVLSAVTGTSLVFQCNLLYFNRGLNEEHGIDGEDKNDEHTFKKVVATEPSKK